MAIEYEVATEHGPRYLPTGGTRMRNMIVIGCVLALACTAIGAISIPCQAGGRADTGVPAVSTAPGDHVPLGHWTYAAISQLQAAKILLGYPRAYFSGVTPRSRAEFAAAINRCLVMILPFDPPPGTSPGEATGGDISKIRAEDIRLLRKLSLEFKPELIALGLDWKAADAYVHKLQDKTHHADVADGLATIAPKPADAAGSPPASGPKPADQLNMFEIVNRPSWVYDALKQLSPRESAINRLRECTLTRYEAAVCVKRCCDAFCDTEDSHSIIAPFARAASSYDLKDVVEVHKLVRTFCVELPQLGMDLKAAEATLSKAEEKRIQLLETVDTRPLTVK
jgi:hypothetical protein